MENTVFITLAIHTNEFAVALKEKLEAAGIPVELQNVNINNPEIACGVRVRIPSAFLAKALHIIETEQMPAVTETKMAGMGKTILVPVDFSDYSFIACRVAFSLAKSLALHPVLIHVYATPYFDGSLSFSDKFIVELRDTETRRNLQKAAELEFKRFCERIDQAMENAMLPRLKYSTRLSEGVPEEVILTYTRQTPPELVVMATRDSGKKARELVGSITAEVLDNSRVPVFAVPEELEFKSLGQMSDVLFFCTIEQNDLIAMDRFAALFPNSSLNITLLPVADKNLDCAANKMEVIRDYFRTHYPLYNVDYKLIPASDFRASLEGLMSGCGITLLVVPNKKRNIFARLFNPGLAHKILFESNMPLLTIPV